MTPKKARLISNCILLVGLLLLFFTAVLDSTFLGHATFLIIVCGLIMDVRFYVCPHCGKHLGRDSCECCRHCGERIDS